MVVDRTHPERAEAFAAQGVTRLVVDVAATDPAGQREEMSSFADRFRLGS